VLTRSDVDSSLADDQLPSPFCAMPRIAPEQ